MYERMTNSTTYVWATTCEPLTIGKDTTEKSRKVNESQIDFLKPCPFCGMDVELKHYKSNPDWWYIVCNHCRIAIDPLMRRSKEEVVEIWNKRYLNGMPITTCNIHPRGGE